ncbi:MAG: helix-turn-helix domain-containing protein [Nitrospirae bacterium]|nr:helix-turn-helix domain-containing protein [Nitrospirota bacterium]MBI3351539.1 helix-turn-helix domain-containing protein [Nitrospirota bacterium]
MSRKSGISRRILYKAFSETGNPTVETLLTLLDTIGVSIRFKTENFKNRKKSVA